MSGMEQLYREEDEDAGAPRDWINTKLCQQGGKLAASAIQSRIPPDAESHKHDHVAKVADDMEKKCLQQIEKELQLLPVSDKHAYLTALDAVPHLVQTESSPLRFLRFHNYNVLAACRGLVHYWRDRREIFGEKALLPMTITGKGALSPKDIDFIRNSRHFTFLPKDGRGHPVICIDLPTNERAVNQNMLMRAAFYVGQVMSAEDCQIDGFVAIHIVHSEACDVASRKCLSLLVETHPIRVEHYHFFDCRQSLESTPFLSLETSLAANFGNFFANIRTSLHSTKSHEEIVRALERRGVTRSGLPSWIGGTWDQEEFDTWLMQRVNFERGGYSTRLPESWTQPSFGSTGDAVVPISKVRVVPTRDSEAWRSCSSAPDITVNTFGVSLELYRQLEDEMKRLPPSLTNAYREALKMVPPALWEEEASLERFLQTESFEIALAAKRIAFYWDLRTEIFGPKRYEYMKQTGDDALERRDLTVLGSGFTYLLPNDEFGRSVLWIDCSRLRDSVPSNSRDRCIFYMFSLLAENAASQIDGAVLILQMESTSLDLAFLERLVSCMPLRLKAIHLLSSQDVSLTITSQLNFGGEIQVHVGSKHEIGKKLEEFGLTKSGLPKSLNGAWGDEKFIQWQELRTRLEWKVPLGLSGRENAVAFEFPAIRPYAILTDADKTERTRRLNVIHSRRKRDRERIEKYVLKDKLEELREEHRKLTQENSTLEGLTRLALAITAREEENTIFGQNPLSLLNSLYRETWHFAEREFQQLPLPSDGAQYSLPGSSCNGDRKRQRHIQQQLYVGHQQPQGQTCPFEQSAMTGILATAATSRDWLPAVLAPQGPSRVTSAQSQQFSDPFSYADLPTFYANEHKDPSRCG